MQKDVWKSKWVKLAPLGKGGQGFAYLACRKDASSDAPTHVLKELKSQTDPERRGRMYREVASLRVLQHPLIAKYADSNADRFQAGEELFLVTEYIPGPTLVEACTREKPLGFSQALVVTSRLLDAVGYCHSQDVVHRDIKPDNIVLPEGKPDCPVLLDFGLSFNQQRHPAGFESDSMQHVGNRFLLLPEHGSRGADKRDPRSDLTQLVGILFFLTTGLFPDTLADEANRMPHDRPAVIPILAGLSPPEQAAAKRIFDLGFITQIARRWTSINTLREALKQAESPETQPKSLQDRLHEIRERILATPDNVILERAAALNQISTQWIINTAKTAAEELGPVVGSWGGFAESPPTNSRGLGGFRFTSKYDQKKQASVSFYSRVQEGEFLLGMLLNKTPRDIGRLPLFDPTAESILKTWIEAAIPDAISECLA